MDALYAEFGWHEAKVISIELKGPNAMELSAQFMSEFREHIPAALAGMPVTEYTDYQSRICRNMLTGEKTAVELPSSNVITLVLGDQGSVIVRPSGTEPKIKLYLTAIDAQQDAAKARLAQLADAMSAYIPN